jgi:hypothetical protein
MQLSTSISRWPRDYFFMSRLKSNSVSNSKTTGTPHRRSATSLHVHSKTKQAGAKHSAASFVSKSKKEEELSAHTPAASKHQRNGYPCMCG